MKVIKREKNINKKEFKKKCKQEKNISYKLMLSRGIVSTIGLIIVLLSFLIIKEFIPQIVGFVIGWIIAFIGIILESESMKKKNILVIVIIILAIALLFPIPMRLKDGGSIKFKALLYSVTQYNKWAPENSEKEYIDGIKIELLGMELINNINEKEETLTVIEERMKLEDVKITAKNIDTTKLVKFDGVLYGKSNAPIDYAGDFSKEIGKINFLIDEDYMPELDEETNSKELFNSSVLEANGKSMLLNVNNVAVLFEAIDKENIKKSNGESLNNTQKKNIVVLWEQY